MPTSEKLEAPFGSISNLIYFFPVDQLIEAMVPITFVPPGAPITIVNKPT